MCETGQHENTAGEKKTEAVLVYGLSFLVPVILMMLVYASVGITCGGDVTPLTFDLKAQYMPFIANLRYLPGDIRGFLFQWGIALGGNNAGLFAYYVASPLNWLTVLFPLSHMPEAIYFLTLLKMGLAGLAFAVYLRCQGRTERQFPVRQVLFAVCYAMMSYTVLYNMCLMWMEGVILLPIILLGVERLLQGKKGLLYLLSLAGLLVCNYYITYMVGLIVGAYLVVQLLTALPDRSIKEKLAVFGRFCLDTVLAFALAMPVLLPALLNIRIGKGQQELIATTNVYEGTLLDVLKKFLPMQYDALSVGKPSVFCGTIVLAFVILFFVQKRSLPEKLGAAALLAFPFLGFVIPAGDYVWNGFREPIGFTYRYAFVFSAVMLILGYRAATALTLKERASMGLLLAGCAYTLFELYLNGSAIVQGINKDAPYTPRVMYDTINTLYEPLAKEIRQEQGFYRMANEQEYYGTNDAMMYGLYGTDFFASTFNANVDALLKNLGCQDDLCIKICAGAAGPVVDSLLGVKYRLGSSMPPGSYIEKDRTTFDNLSLKRYENTQALSLGFAVPQNGEDIAYARDVYENQNRLLDFLWQEGKEVFHRIPCEVTQIEGETPCYEYAFTVPSEESIYFFPDVYLELDGTAELYFDEQLFEIADARQIRFSQELGTFTPGDSHVIRISGDILACIDMYLYSFDQEAYENAVAKLRSCQWELTEFAQGKAVGTVQCETGQEMLYTTIPYDEGFRVLVDGKKTEYALWTDTFLCVPLDGGGTHQIEITYCPPGLLPGLAACAVSLAAVLGFGVGAVRRRQKREDKVSVSGTGEETGKGESGQ